MKYGFVKVSACIPEMRVADIRFNVERIKESMDLCENKKIRIAVFPELSITGYTCGDLFLQDALIKGAKKALLELKEYTEGKQGVYIVGVPLVIDNALYDCGAVLFDGQVLGIVPKTVLLPDERRRFKSAADLPETTLWLDEEEVPVGSELLFQDTLVEGLCFGVEIGEDFGALVPPSVYHAAAGASIVFNLSASTEETGIRSKRLNRIKQHSERCIFGYVYTSSGINESTTDAVYGGHGIIAENGSILAESQRFSFDSQLVISEIDTDMIRNLRLKNAVLFDGIMTDDYCIVQYDGSPLCDTVLTRRINPYPFIAEGKEELDEQCKELLDIQSSAIAKRLKHAGLKKAVLGVSGGLDSTLTLIAIVKAMDKLQYPRKNIIAITMPGFGTTDRTYDNAVALIKAFGADFREISITEACLQHFKDIGHDPSIHDAAYENAQARERTQILMDIANKEGALHVGTGDLSESALGWCTYNGDHMSMYVVNAGVTKTLIRHVVKWVGENLYKETEEILNDILSTPVSPELLPKNAEGSISQKTEDIVGPYELHDFFLYHMIQYGSSPDKIYYLARHAFRDKYDKETVKKWLTVFLKRFFSQQFKRSCSTDGPKVGSISLSPRGAWMMPSDGAADTWLETLE
jgi:NAD+ synthase (glutamine-hydrolysing)